MKTVRSEQRQARGRAVGGSVISESVPAVVGASYLLRSILFNRSDKLVVLRIEKQTEDGSLIILWKILRVFDPPTAGGPDPVE